MFENSAFWLAFGFTFGLAHLLPESASRSRAALLAGVSLFALFYILALPLTILLVLLGSVAWILVGLRIARPREEISSVKRGLVVVAPVLLAWIAGKQMTGMGYEPLSWLYFAGFSFFLVKAWTLIKDYLDGRFDKLDPVSVLAYFLHFPTYLSGPMHYYVEFEQSLEKPLDMNSAGWVDSLFRLMLGLVKVRFLVPLLTPLSLTELLGAESADLQSLITGCVVYSFVLYFDFSGYSDMAIATSRMLRVDVPENFNNPYMARNLREFWQRWHISFTRVLTAYVFIPVTRALGKPLGTRRRTISALGTFIAFGFCGYWHGATANFVLWGLYHAVGLVVYDTYRNWKMLRRRGKQRVAPSALVAFTTACISVAATFAFVSVGWILFVFPVDWLF
jgi:alginate O-acetyltransferase complex protein AlgI